MTNPQPPARVRRSVLRAVILPAGVAASLVLVPLPGAVAAPSADAVISEVYGGGGNSGAVLKNDFVELANKGGAAFGLAGWSVQYISGTPGATSQWAVTPLTGAIPVGGRYLIGESAGAGGTVDLPTPDATGSLALSAANGTIALVQGTDPLSCKTAADCAADARVKDLVGFGTAVVHEGSAAAAGAGNTASVARAAGLADTDDNAADLKAGTPTPVNSRGETVDLGGTPTGPTEPGPLRIHDIQGTTRLSPEAGKVVTGVPGVVTGLRTSGTKGFWLQDTHPDADPATSEGIFVYTGSAVPTVKVGDSVLVTGKVSEYYPAYTSGSQSVTELSNPAVTVLSSGNALPAPVVLNDASIPAVLAPDANGGSIDGLTLKPDTYALDKYESLEGMLVQVKDTKVVQATDKYNELWVEARKGDVKSTRGGALYLGYQAPNSGRLMVQTQGAKLPLANVGDQLLGVTAGPLDYNQFGGYTIAAGTVGSYQDNHLQREVTAPAPDGTLTIATYNVENLDPGDPDDKFAQLAQGVVTNLRAPDVVALEEIQDNNGPAGDGVVDASVTIGKFIDAVKAAGGPAYEWRSINPVDGKDGGEPDGNIRQVFLFNPARVSFTDIPGGDSTTAVDVAGTGASVALTASPGRIDPNNEAWMTSRKPLVGQFSFRGKKVFVIANHFNSKGGDQGIDSRFQAPTRSSEVQRVKQAAVENAFVSKLETADPEAKIVSLGDFNDYQFSPALQTLTGGGVLRDLVNDLYPSQRYTYVYQGNSQVLDHTLVSPALTNVQYDVVHVNSEFAVQASDHDPQIVRVRP
ncbi:endonuclease [Kitasatospora sp. MMS16-BH015]|uniref:endonuclease/exonuclease/phosphatase family protein n=1 Tax=Kitasatospora sp. MMS16-BH015 TaxID=2018025 RepID=UPI000CA0A128|nr:endonuclease/exonuclease/phosphatase family protein [Kitasatospora sp. MMS16-BH015]AUG76478.1 endonuclease [Kitasatospora sp. MMS16-BH015]